MGRKNYSHTPIKTPISIRKPKMKTKKELNIVIQQIQFDNMIDNQIDWLKEKKLEKRQMANEYGENKNDN